MNQVEFFPGQWNPYLDDRGTRRSLKDATHLVLKAEGRVALIREDPECWFQPMGFLSATRGQPWFLHNAWELGIPMFLRHELVRIIVELLDWCGYQVGETNICNSASINLQALMLVGEDLLKLPVRRHHKPSVCPDVQIVVNRRDCGRIMTSIPTPGGPKIMETRYITSPYYGPLNDLQWNLWVLHIMEIFALANVRFTRMASSEEMGDIFKVISTRPDDIIHHSDQL